MSEFGVTETVDKGSSCPRVGVGWDGRGKGPVDPRPPSRLSECVDSTEKCRDPSDVFQRDPVSVTRERPRVGQKIGGRRLHREGGSVLRRARSPLWVRRALEKKGIGTSQSFCRFCRDLTSFVSSYISYPIPSPSLLVTLVVLSSSRPSEPDIHLLRDDQTGLRRTREGSVPGPTFLYGPPLHPSSCILPESDHDYDKTKGESEDDE